MRSSLDCEIDSNGSVCDLLTTAQVNFSLFMLTTNFQETKFNNSRKKKLLSMGKIATLNTKSLLLQNWW